MSTLFEPSPILLAFLALKTTLYLPSLMLLALLRSLAATGPARIMALLALLIAAAGLAARLVPPLIGLDGGTVAQAAYGFADAGGGMAVPLAGSAALAGSGLMRGRTWWGLDLLHGLLLGGLILLWWLAQ